MLNAGGLASATTWSEGGVGMGGAVKKCVDMLCRVYGAILRYIFMAVA